MEMCQRCKQDFDPQNNDFSCQIHPESHSGETAQRWKNPGDESGGAKIQSFYSCCGAHDINSKGCALFRHYSYSESAPSTYNLREGQDRLQQKQKIIDERIKKTTKAWEE